MEHLSREMLIDIDSYDQEGRDLISSIPELNAMPSWALFKGDRSLKRNAVTKYLIYVYSFDSFLNVQKVRMPLQDRKLKALTLAGLTNGTGNVDEDIMEYLFWLKEPLILDMVLEYLRFQRQEVWTQIVLCEHEMAEADRVRLTPIDEFTKDGLQVLATKVKKNLREESVEMLKTSEELYRKFWGDFIDVKDASRKRMTTIENRAKDLLADVSEN